MGIFQILFHNSGQKIRTLTPADQTTPEGYRGALVHDVSLCTGCGTCAYVCSPGAIHVDKNEGEAVWRYEAVACTFCARCAEYCPTQAITLTRLAPKTAVGERESLLTRHVVEKKPCERCGQPFIPLPVPVLARLTGHQPGAEIEAADDLPRLYRMCEKCRARVTSQRFKESLTGTSHSAGGSR